MAVAREAFMLPMNVNRPHDKPRASGIGSCARQQGYSMAGAATTNEPGGPDNDLTTEQGRIVDEQVTQRLFVPHGIKVVNSQISLPDDFPMTGHPDGELAFLEDEHEGGWRERDVNNVKWGYEHKNLGRWAYETVLKQGFEMGEPGYLCQTVTYGMGLGWDAAYVVCLSQDASSVRSDMRINLKSKNPKVRWANDPMLHPKLMTYGIDLHKYYGTLGKRLIQRAEWLTEWYHETREPSHIAREANPEALTRDSYVALPNGEVERTEGPEFPCSWCPWLAQCLKDGNGGDRAPELPFALQKEME